MVENCQIRSAAARFKRSGCGPLGPHLGDFAERLSEQGYIGQTGVKKIGLVVFLSRWLARNGVGLESLNEQSIADFTESQRELLSRRTQVQHTLCQLMQYLRESGAIPSPLPSVVATGVDCLLDEYGEFLTNERGL
ncbi:MAG: hypothetical protein NTW21_03680, partial [Verrucomicrobia bacterium]|nr:hypothetical protein [Verrucomicrobiota bacterium]